MGCDQPRLSGTAGGLDARKRCCLPQEEDKAMNQYQELWWEQSRSDQKVLLLLRLINFQLTVDHHDSGTRCRTSAPRAPHPALGRPLPVGARFGESQQFPDLAVREGQLVAPAPCGVRVEGAAERSNERNPASPSRLVRPRLSPGGTPNGRTAALAASQRWAWFFDDRGLS